MYSERHKLSTVRYYLHLHNKMHIRITYANENYLEYVYDKYIVRLILSFTENYVLARIIDELN